MNQSHLSIINSKLPNCTFEGVLYAPIPNSEHYYNLKSILERYIEGRKLEYLEFEFYDKNRLAFTCVLKSIHKSESAYNMFGLLDAFRFSFISSYEEMIMAFHKLRKKISRRKEDKYLRSHHVMADFPRFTHKLTFMVGINVLWFVC
ncbi:unnamed protein product [Albugo candida]|uniref:Uncharacterized protein n=1 Tax=Albugo candida TaxID=65357 RepID=A0A024FWV5_9STRA|nr:unnamed protein product [Albugo candida]|eukprot:CCI11144.1 unnamed protein product [Albugo candida]